MSAEIWYRIWCPNPECGTTNWVYGGDPQDCTFCDSEAVKCHKCGQCWWVDSEWKDMVGEDASVEDHAEEGDPAPSGCQKIEKK